MELGDVHSLVPRLMALTATATKETRKAVCHILGMISPVLIIQVPNRANINYIVHSDHGTRTLEETFAEEMREVNQYGRGYSVCRTYNSC